MRNAGKAGDMVFLYLGFEFRYALRTTGAAQFAVHMYGDTTRIVTAIFKPFEAFNKNWCDVTLRHSADNSAHAFTPFILNRKSVLCTSREEINVLILCIYEIFIHFSIKTMLYFIYI